MKCLGKNLLKNVKIWVFTGKYSLKSEIFCERITSFLQNEGLLVTKQVFVKKKKNGALGDSNAENGGLITALHMSPPECEC